ncbi:MAG: DUF362 domain-containing protein [Nanoarchaeota archaeon]
MVKGVSVKFASYAETVPKLLKLIKLDQELKKHEHIVIKPLLVTDKGKSTNIDFIEELVRFCVQHKNPSAEVFVAEGVDGADTMDIYDQYGYRRLAETYGIGLVDLNKTACETIGKNEFVGFETIMYPIILKDSFVISASPLRTDEATVIAGSVANMRGAFPASRYKGFFSNRKNKLDSHPMKYQLHDIALCKMPNLGIIDGSSNSILLAGQPIEIDRQMAKVLGLDAKSVGHLRMLEETLLQIQEKAAEREQAERSAPGAHS